MKKILKGKDRELHKKFQEYGSSALMWKRKCILMLLEIDEAKIWEKKGFNTLHEYAGRLAGLSNHLVTDGLRILRKTVNMPHIRAVIEKRGINIIKPIEALLTVENEKFWAEKACAMSMHVLEQYVRDLKKLDRFEHRAMLENSKNDHQQAISNFGFERCEGNQQVLTVALENHVPESAPKMLVPMELSPENLQKLLKLKGQESWNELLTELLEDREDQLESEKPAAVYSQSRYIPIAILRYLLKRTNGTCAFPHCNKPFDEIHHTLRFSLTKTHDPDHMEILCAAHHSLAHHGLINNEECGAENWRVSLVADTGAAKFEVDQLVAQYRRG